MKPLIETKNLTIKFGSRTILENINLQIQEGELISLIGLNGSGKSTLLKALVGLISATSGQIIKHTEKIFYIPQNSDFDNSFPTTVQEFCQLFGGKNYHEYLEKVGVKKLLHQNVRNLSGGQFQRVLIALGLSNQPKLLLLDEPTSGIDIAGESSFYKLIHDIKEQFNVSIVLVSHDIHLVIKHATRVICLTNHICCQGSVEEVTSSDDFQKVFGQYLKPYVHKHDHHHE